MSQRNATWWGERQPAVETSVTWRVGPLEVVVRRRAAEWQVGHRRLGDADEQAGEVRFEEGDRSPEELESFERFVLRRTEPPLRAVAALADRPCVASPRVPVHLPAGEAATLYVGSPLWLRLEVGRPPRPLWEAPILRPSDTWFGPSTRVGEMCYSTRTRAMLDPGNLPPLPRQAVTPVVVRNDAPESLRLERLKLPVPLLSVYADRDGRLWTEPVTLVRGEISEMARIEVGQRAPREAQGAERICAPREKAEHGLLIRAFSTLFRD